MIKYPQNITLPVQYILMKLSEFWKEDMPNGDVTTLSTIPDDIYVNAEIQVAVSNAIKNIVLL